MPTVLNLGLAAVAMVYLIAVMVFVLEQRRSLPRHRLPPRFDLRPGGTVLWVLQVLCTAAPIVVSPWILVSIRPGVVSAMLMRASVVLAALLAIGALQQLWEGWEPAIRQVWRRPTSPAPVCARWPKVSVQVPCHAEPPDLVIGTLDRLAALDYPNFEVVVVDNNTEDRRLWEPVQRYCERLGDRFRFLHVEGIDGAKGGALNWARRYIAPDTELIGVVDADYHVEPDWLRSTVGYFEDPSIGFVQCPHAYRGYHHSRFGRMANFEYKVTFATQMRSLNEHGAGLIVGTMSLVRRDVLDQVGGWATWCLTEDSELAIRVHAAGYESVNLHTPYGRGLIPETFASYRKQRFRWTYGPVQEFKRHWRLYIPGGAGGSNALSWRQRMHHAGHGIQVVIAALRPVGFLMWAAAFVSMYLNDELARVPVMFWLTIVVQSVGRRAVDWVIHRRVVGGTVAQVTGGMLANASLRLVIFVAAMCAVIGRRTAWHRTNKFRPGHRGLGAIGSAGAEIAVAVALLTAALAAAAIFGMAAWLLVGSLVVLAVPFLAAPIVAVLAERSIRRHPERLPQSFASVNWRR